MTNKEYYKEQIFEIACDDQRVAVTGNGVIGCDTIQCYQCKLYNAGGVCREAFRKWLDEEYMPVKVSEAVQNAERNDVILVSHDRQLWKKAYLDYYDSDNDVVWCFGSPDGYDIGSYDYAQTVNEFVDYCLT